MIQPFNGSAESFAQTKPDAIAFIEGDKKITWTDYNTQADRLAHSLLNAGIKPGDRVAVMMAIRHEWFIVYLAACKVGAFVVGVNSKSTEDEAGFVLEDSSARGLVIDSHNADAIIAIAKKLGIEAFVTFIPTTMVASALYGQIVANASISERRVSAAPIPPIFYTSGTTGRPKGVALDPTLLAGRENLQAYRELMASVVPISESSRFLLTLPLHHSAGPNSALFCLRAGGSVVVQPKFDPLETLSLIQQHGVTNWMAVPTMIHRLAALSQSQLDAFDRSSVRAVTVGAASVPVSLKFWSASFFGDQCLIFEGYGMSETQMISYLLPEDWVKAPESSGKPMRYVDVKIIGPDGTTLAANLTGEICVRTPMMIDRYLNRQPLGPDDLTHDGFFRTGDVGRLDEVGYLYVTDRIKDMIIVGGTNVYPAEVEAALHTHPWVLEAAVIGLPHSDLGEQVLAICEMIPSAPHEGEALIAHCRTKLAVYKVPRMIEFRDELPRNATGKVTKQVLREPYWRGRGKI